MSIFGYFFGPSLSDLQKLALNYSQDKVGFFKKIKVLDSEQDLLVVKIANCILNQKPVSYKGDSLKEIPYTNHFLESQSSKLSLKIESFLQAVMNAPSKSSLTEPKRKFLNETREPIRLIRFGLAFKDLIALAGKEMAVFVSKGKNPCDVEVVLALPKIFALRLLKQARPFIQMNIPQIFRDSRILKELAASQSSESFVANYLNDIRVKLERLSQEEFLKLEVSFYESKKPEDETLASLYDLISRVGYAISRGSCASVMNEILSIAADQNDS